MWTIIRHYLITANNFAVLIMLYPMLIVLNRVGEMNISSAVSNIDIVVYPIIYYGFFVKFPEALIERLPISKNSIRLAKRGALYIVLLLLFAENISILYLFDTVRPYEIAASMFRVNLLFVLAMILSPLFFKGSFSFSYKGLTDMLIKLIPLLVYILINIYLLDQQAYIQILFSIVFYPLFELWNYLKISKHSFSS